MNEIIEYRRNRRGEFVAGHRQTLRALGIAFVSIALMGGIAHFGQRISPILPTDEVQAAGLPEGCQRTDSGLACDFTTQETIDNLRKHVPMRDMPDAITSTSTDADTVEARIRYIAWEEGYQDVEFLVRLAKCESRLDPYAVNGNGNKPTSSVDRGLYQINDHWQRGVANDKAFDLEWATRWTINKLKAGGKSLWMCTPIVERQMGRR